MPETLSQPQTQILIDILDGMASGLNVLDTPGEQKEFYEALSRACREDKDLTKEEVLSPQQIRILQDHFLGMGKGVLPREDPREQFEWLQAVRLALRYDIDPTIRRYLDRAIVALERNT